MASIEKVAFLQNVSSKFCFPMLVPVPQVRSWSALAGESLAIALAYFLLARLGQFLAIEPGNVTAIWPASGFALAVVLYRGYHTWLGLWIGNFLGNTWAFLDTSTLSDALRTIATGVAIGPGDVFQALLGAYLIRRFCHGGELFSRIRNVFLFVGSQSLACLSSATFGVLALCSGSIIGWDAYAYTWLTWFLGDGIGVILVAPILLTLPQAKSLLSSPRLTAEGLLILSMTGVTSYLVFGGAIHESLIFLPIVFVLWAAVRANQFAVSATILALWSVALCCSLQGRGPFSIGDTNDALMLLQLYAAIAMVTGSVVSAAISEVNAKEQDLRRNESRFRSAVEASSSGILVLDDDGTQQLVNPEVSRLFGYSAEDLIGRPVEMLFDHASTGKIHALRRSALAYPGKSNAAELKARRRDGSEFEVEFAVRSLETDQGTKLLCSLVDITSRQETFRALREAKRMAEDASLAKSEFLANVSHEIRTPMNAVIGMSDLMLDTELTPMQRDYLATIAESADSLMVIINEVLDFSSIEAGQVDVESVPFSLRGMVGTTLRSLAALAHEKQLELVARVSPGAPDALCGDPSRLSQVMCNLVGNAIKFTQQGEVFVDIVTSKELDPEIILTVTVRDTGIGIPEDRHAAIFEAFTQVDMSTTRKFGGTGLGLSVAQTLAELMGGRINLSSEVNVGSTFTFSIPLRLATEDEIRDHGLASKQIDLRHHVVLVVDDSETSRKVLSEMLEDWGATVVTATDGARAMEVLRQPDSYKPFSLIISDVQMPGISGLDLAHAIREIPELKGVPVILLTSTHELGETESIDESGAAAHLVKPIGPHEFVDAIKIATERN